jgi:hypothetical protein
MKHLKYLIVLCFFACNWAEKKKEKERVDCRAAFEILKQDFYAGRFEKVIQTRFNVSCKYLSYNDSV